MSAKQLAVIGLAAAALTATGCGGSSKKNAASTTASVVTSATTAAQTKPSSTGAEIKISSGKPLSRAAWISKGDTICGRVNVKLSTTSAHTQQDYARLLPQSAAYERQEAVELSKLVPPARMRADWQQVVTDLQKFSELSIRTGEYAAVNKFQSAMPIARAGNKAQEEMVLVAKRDGFKVCSLP